MSLSTADQYGAASGSRNSRRSTSPQAVRCERSARWSLPLRRSETAQGRLRTPLVHPNSTSLVSNAPLLTGFAAFLPTGTPHVAAPVKLSQTAVAWTLVGELNGPP